MVRLGKAVFTDKIVNLQELFARVLFPHIGYCLHHGVEGLLLFPEDALECPCDSLYRSGALKYISRFHYGSFNFEAACCAHSL